MPRRLPIAASCLVATLVSAHPGFHDEVASLADGLARDPSSVTLLVERAYRERLEGQLQPALADLDRAALLSPEDLRVAAERGMVLSALGRDIDADLALSRFLDRAPATAPVLAERARVRRRLGRPDEAIRDFSRAIELRPDPDLYLQRGELLERSGRFDEAAAGYREGLRRLSGAVSIRSALVRLEWSRGRWAAALAFKDAELGRVRPSRAETRSGENPLDVTVQRQPYLQIGTEASMTIAWRTDLPTDSRVRFGTTFGALDQSVDLAASSTDHVVSLGGLTPSTRYYYDVGSTSGPQAGGTLEHYFETSPPSGSSAPFRAWVVGDSGTGDAAQAAVRDAMLAATGTARPQLYLHLGDIAYTTGTDLEFTAHHFVPYQDILRHTVLWPTLGNHEGLSTVSGAPGPSIGPYYEAFVLPGGGEAGGEPSGTEAYYSFDYANVHFVCLNSYQVDRSATGAMAVWLAADLASNLQPWVIAFWHHPPYTHGSHNSDFEIEHVEMRENLLPILEDAGVDLVLGGHSHGYERSVLIDGSYTTPTPDLPTLVAQGQVINGGDGKPSGRGAYRKDPGINPHAGAVFVVAGHGGAATGGVFGHPVMYFSEANLGSVLLDVDGDALTLTNLRSTGEVSDSFTLVKRLQNPVVQSVAPARGSVAATPLSILVGFSVPVTGVDAADLTVGGTPASSVVAHSPDRYLFQLDPQPPIGGTTVVLAPGGIADASNASLSFEGDQWTYDVAGTPCTSDGQCTLPGQSCEAAGICVDGYCATGPGPDGTPCDDGNACTSSDACFFGICTGAITVPADVTNLGWLSDKTTLLWDETSGAGGSYDLARGGPADLPVEAGSPACLEQALVIPSGSDITVPEEGSFFWYLVRGSTACGPGTWGDALGPSGPQVRQLSACP